MTMRMKERYWKGFTKSLNYNPHEPVLPGAALEDERRELNALYGTISAEEFDQRQKAIYKKGLATLRKKAPVLLKMPLDHGSIVVMHGAEMQKYYEVWASLPRLQPLFICMHTDMFIHTARGQAYR